MISVEEALGRILAAAQPLGRQEVPLEEALGLTTAAPLIATRTQPPTDLSAMDGYAVRTADFSKDTPAAPLSLVGTSAAGAGFDGHLNPGQTVRIFTGARVPKGADAILLQEDARVTDQGIIATEIPRAGQHIRRSGLDFNAGETVLDQGQTLGPRQIGLAAAATGGRILVHRRPVVALLTTGDELVPMGGEPGPDQIINANSPGLAALITQAGATVRDLGIARDTPQDLREKVAAAGDCDMLVTVGGASVGDHDLIRPVLGDLGLTLDFWKIAMKPGKPLIFGDWKGRPMLGLPGNPVSAMVCALVFLVPALKRMMGHAVPSRLVTRQARLAAPMAANGTRQDFVRASLTPTEDPLPFIKPFDRQDSSMLSLLARADALLVRPPHAAEAKPGDTVAYLPLS